MVLVPLLTRLTQLREDQIFPASLAVILPVSLTCLFVTSVTGSVAWSEALTWLPGSGLGGVLAGFFGQKIPVKWLHRVLGIFILWGGIRYLC